MIGLSRYSSPTSSRLNWINPHGLRRRVVVAFGLPFNLQIADLRFWFVLVFNMWHACVSVHLLFVSLSTLLCSCKIRLCISTIGLSDFSSNQLSPLLGPHKLIPAFGLCILLVSSIQETQAQSGGEWRLPSFFRISLKNRMKEEMRY